jgi:hypothetical protein
MILPGTEKEVLTLWSPRIQCSLKTKVDGIIQLSTFQQWLCEKGDCDPHFCQQASVYLKPPVHSYTIQ